MIISNCLRLTNSPHVHIAIDKPTHVHEQGLMHASNVLVKIILVQKAMANADVQTSAFLCTVLVHDSCLYM